VILWGQMRVHDKKRAGKSAFFAQIDNAVKITFNKAPIMTKNCVFYLL
jgi:hypothetical protein